MKILMVDIETAPNVVHSWGIWNINVGLNQIMEPGYILSWAAKWLGKREMYFDSVHQSKPEEMLKSIWRLLDECDAVVHYNGAKFDIPTLNREFLLHGMLPPSPYKQIDLLRTIKQRFRFLSNKLAYISQRLGIGAKVKHYGHELWVQCMAGDDKAWRIMEKYNKQDVRLLERGYKELRPWIRNHPNFGVYENRMACTNCGNGRVHKRGFSRTNVFTYQRYQCQGCGAWLRGRKRIKSKSPSAGSSLLPVAEG